MEGTRKWKKAGFSTILWAVATIMLSAVPYAWADETVPAGEEWDIDYDVGDFLNVYGTANLDTGAYAAYGIKAYSGSTVNIRGGNTGAGFAVTVFNDPTAAAVTVYGTDFAVTTGTIVDGSWVPVGGSGTLTGFYGNGDPISLLFYSDVPIYLSAPGVTNQPPVAIAGQEGLIGPGGKIHPIYSSEQDITIVLGQASDPEAQPIVYRWFEGPTPLLDWTAVATPPEAYLDLSTLPLFSIGDHTLVLEALEVSDDMLSSTDDMVLRILNTPPSAGANPPSMTVGIGDPISIGAEVADFDGDPLTYEWLKGATVLASGAAAPPAGGDPVIIAALTGTGGTAPFELGLNELVIAVIDGVIPVEVSGTVTVEVIDTEAPTLAPTASEVMLWPPNHTLRTITIQANAEDNSGGPVTLGVEVTSNEPDEDDWVIDSVDNATGEIQLRLRAERSGSDDGRVYTVTITATDEADNSSTAIVEIRVPHDKRKK